MATTQEELDLAFVEVGTQIKAARALIGILANLETTNKTNVIAAINELKNSIAGAGAVINDSSASSSSVYSSSKTDTQIANAAANLKTEILGGAGPTVDTLKEIADLLAASDLNDDNAIAALTTAVGNRIRFDAAQSLTAPEKVQANANLGSVSLAQFGDPAHSYKNVFDAAVA